ncbi:MAG: hypothetical protein ACKOOI_07595 [Pirellula sp.]
MKTIATGLIFFVAACFCGVSQAQSLQWKLKKGQVLSIESINEMVTMVKLPDGSTQEMPMKNQIDTEWKVSDSDDKSFAVETTIKRARTSMKSPFTNVDYDSEKEAPKDPVGKQLAASIKQVLGIPILMKIGRQGNLLEMKLPESIQKLGSDATGPIPTRSLESFFASSQQLQIPEGEMKIGTKWEQTIKSNDNGMQTKANVTYRYEGAVEEGGRKLAKILTEATTELVQSPQGIELSLEDVGSQGEIFFDIELGCISKAVQRQKHRLIMNVGGQKVSQDIEGSTTTIFRLAN